LAGIDAGLAGVEAAADIGTAWARPPAPPLLKATASPDETTLEVLDEAESKRLLARYGVPVPASRIVGSADEAAKAAEELGFPVVVKALGVAHKTDVGGVVLDLQTVEDVATAVNYMSNLSERYLIEKMVDGVVAELIVGVARDEQFGPYLVVGAGGILVELMRDSQSLLLPVSREKVMEALGALKCAPLFHGFRGRPRADLNAAADAIMSIAQFVQEKASSIAELDVNPLMLRAEGQGVIAADALIRMSLDD
jgi:acetyl-CoA synthetase